MNNAYFPPNAGAEADFSIWDKITLWLWKSPQVSAELESLQGLQLEQIQTRLRLFCRLLNDLPHLQVIGVADEGGWSEPVFFLPSQISFGATLWQNLQFYLFRVLYLTVQRKRGLNWQAAGDYPLSLSRQKSQESAQAILSEVYQVFTGTETWIPPLLIRLRQEALFEAEHYLPWGRWISPVAGRACPQGSEPPSSCLPEPACQALDIASVGCEHCGTGLIHYLN